MFLCILLGVGGVQFWGTFPAFFRKWSQSNVSDSNKWILSEFRFFSLKYSGFGLVSVEIPESG